MKRTAAASILCSVLLGLTCLPTTLCAKTSYPLIFDSADKLKDFGLAVEGREFARLTSGHFENLCYYYGDGGWMISISSSLFAYYKSQGFTLRTACLALISGIRFNPETGAHLATYVIVDKTSFDSRRWKGTWYADYEMPLSLPSCFKRGLPYSDCAWNFDPLTGRRAKQPAEIKYAPRACVKANPDLRSECSRHWTVGEVGALIERYLGGLKGKKRDDCSFQVRIAEDKWLRHDVRNSCDLSGVLDDRQFYFYIAYATIYDFSSEFPKGYAYALYAFGGAGGSVEPGILKAAITGQRPPPDIDPDELKRIWGIGAGAKQ